MTCIHGHSTVEGLKCSFVGLCEACLGLHQAIGTVVQLLNSAAQGRPIREVLRLLSTCICDGTYINGAMVVQSLVAEDKLKHLNVQCSPDVLCVATSTPLPQWLRAAASESFLSLWFIECAIHQYAQQLHLPASISCNLLDFLLKPKAMHATAKH